jgi:Holliday junction resolvase RusA-like endonuclease
VTITFTVIGVSEPQGSSSAHIPKGWTRPIVTSANKDLKFWRQAIANTAAVEMALSRAQPFAAGPVALDVTFYLPRPKKFLSKKWGPVPVPHVSKPDTDKLLRGCKDALTRVVWHDDSQVTDVVARKRYCAAGEMPRAVITVTAVAVPLVPTKTPGHRPTLLGLEDHDGEAQSIQ